MLRSHWSHWHVIDVTGTVFTEKQVCQCNSAVGLEPFDPDCCRAVGRSGILEGDHIPMQTIGGAPAPFLFPLDRCGWFGGDIIQHPVDTGDFIDNAGCGGGEEVMIKRVAFRGHAI